MSVLSRFTSSAAGAVDRRFGWDRLPKPLAILTLVGIRAAGNLYARTEARPKHDPCPVDDVLAEGDALGPLQVLHAAGHSPGPA